jgi:hypothetical protein
MANAAETEAVSVPEKLYSRQDLCRLFGVARGTPDNWVKSGLLSEPLKVGRHVYWTPADVAAMLKRRGPSQ